MKGPREWMANLSEKLDLPCAVAAQLPCTLVDGFHSVTVDLQKGLIAYSEDAITVAVPLGQIVISGASLSIKLMKQERIIVTGLIRSIDFLREDDHV